MQNNFRYINLSWAVVGFFEAPHQPLSSCIPGIEEDEAAAVERYVIGYMAFWHIAFVDESRLVPCHDDALRTEARRKIDRYVAELPRSCPNGFSVSRDFREAVRAVFPSRGTSARPPESSVTLAEPPQAEGVPFCGSTSSYSLPLSSAFNRKRLRKAWVASAGVSVEKLSLQIFFLLLVPDAFATAPGGTLVAAVFVVA